MVRLRRPAIRLARRGPPAWDRVTVAGLGLLLIALVAVASRQGGGSLPNTAGAGLLVLTLAAETLLLCGLVAALVMVVLNIWALFPTPRRRPQPRPASFVQTLVSALFLLLVAYAVTLWRRLPRPPVRGSGPPSGLLTSPRTPAPGLLFQTGYEWLAVLLTVVLVLTAAVFLFRLRGAPRAVSATLPSVSPHPAAPAAFEAAARVIEQEPDPRQAVIAAYLELEHRLAEHGIARRDPETPTEYLTRALGSLSALAAPLRELTGLFEVARFSSHPVDEGARRDATAALAAIRRGLSTRSSRA